MKERLKVHREIDRKNREKFQAWKEREEIRELNKRIAEEELDAMRAMGVIA